MNKQQLMAEAESLVKTLEKEIHDTRADYLPGDKLPKGASKHLARCIRLNGRAITRAVRRGSEFSLPF